MSKSVNRIDEEKIKDNVLQQSKLSKDEKRIAYIFSERLNDLIEKRNYHQDELADKTNLSTGCISNYRNGKRVPDLVTIVKLAKILGTTPSYLCGSSESMNEECACISSIIGLNNDAIIQLARFKQKKLFGNIELKETIGNSIELEFLSIFINSQYSFSMFINLVINYVKKINRLNELTENLKGKNEFELLYNKDKDFIEKKCIEDEIITLKIKINETIIKLINESFKDLSKTVKKYDAMDNIRKGDE